MGVWIAHHPLSFLFWSAIIIIGSAIWYSVAKAKKTGQSFMQASGMNAFADAQVERNATIEAKRDAPVKCPKCGGTQITSTAKGFSTGKAIAGTLLTGNLIGTVVGGSVGSKKITITCLKCGKQWQP